MAIEIEYKYLVKAEVWKEVVPEKSIKIRQGYLLTDPDKTIRVRTKGSSGYITIKGKVVGASRPEFEYEIPLADANQLIDGFCSNVVEKIRHLIVHDHKTWEVDVFSGMNEGLIVAEIELTREDEKYSLPEWVDKEVTDDIRYANSNLSIKPFKTW